MTQVISGITQQFSFSVKVVSLDMLLGPLFLGEVTTASSRPKMEFSNLDALKNLLQAVEIFFKFDLIMN